jgi:hypothetical protein
MPKRSQPKLNRNNRKGHSRAAPAAPVRGTRGQVSPAPLASQQASVPPPPIGPDPGAIGTFEAAVRALQGHDYQAAASAFRHLLAAFPRERALLDRARVYLNVCERELRNRPSAPSTLEERLTAATAALNDDDDKTAERLARDVLRESAEHDLALYLLAAVHGRRGDTATALELLRRAVDVSPDVRAQARHDPDFDRLRELSEFHELLAPPFGNHMGGRRPRRARSDR